MQDTTPATLEGAEPSVGLSDRQPQHSSTEVGSTCWLASALDFLERFTQHRLFVLQRPTFLLWKGASPQPFAHHWVPSGALPVYIRHGFACSAGAPYSSPWLKPGASKGHYW